MPGVWVFPGGAVDDGRPTGPTTRRPTGPAPRASSTRRRGSSWPPTRRWSCGRAGSPRRSSPPASTPGSTSPSPRPTPRRSRTASETVDAGWFAPTAALESCTAGELQLVFPTIKQLESLRRLPERRRGARGRPRASEVEPILPKVTGEASERRIVLPGEPGYERQPHRRYFGPMTATLPQDVRERVLDRFITCEYTTIDARQPADHLARHARTTRDGGATIDVTTGLGYPKKANDARANPQVCAALLRPDRLGPEQRADGPRPGHRARSTTATSTPTASATGASPARSCRRRRTCTRRSRCARMLDWYYTRLYVKVRPERVFVWRGRRPLEAARAASTPTMEEVRSGHAEEPLEPHAAPEGGAARLGRADRRARQPLRDRGRSPGSRPTASRSRRASRSSPSRRCERIRSAHGPPACRSTGAAPASPPTRTRPTSRGSRTSRSAATSSARATPGRSSRTSWSAASSCPTRAGSRWPAATSPRPAASGERPAQSSSGARPGPVAAFRPGRLARGPSMRAECAAAAPTRAQPGSRMRRESVRVSEAGDAGRGTTSAVPRTPGDLPFRDVFRRYPGTVLDEAEHWSILGLCVASRPSPRLPRLEGAVASRLGQAWHQSRPLRPLGGGDNGPTLVGGMARTSALPSPRWGFSTLDHLGGSNA